MGPHHSCNRLDLICEHVREDELEVDGVARFDGNLTFGDATGDTITFAQDTTDISFSDASFGDCTLKTSSGTLICGTDLQAAGGGGSLWTHPDGGYIYPNEVW